MGGIINQSWHIFCYNYGLDGLNIDKDGYEGYHS
jgi:hypothetical protein